MSEHVWFWFKSQRVHSSHYVRVVPSLTSRSLRSRESQRVHYTAAFFRRLRFVAGERLTQYPSLSDRCTELTKNATLASVWRSPPNEVVASSLEATDQLTREFCGCETAEDGGTADIPDVLRSAESSMA